MQSTFNTSDNFLDERPRSNVAKFLILESEQNSITTTENLTSIFWEATLGKTVDLYTVTEFPRRAKHGSSKSRLAIFVTLSQSLHYGFVLESKNRQKRRNEIKIRRIFFFRKAAWQSGQGAWLDIGGSRVQVSLWPLAGFVPGSPWLNSSAALVYSQLVCLLPVGILNLLSLFQTWSACEVAWEPSALPL